MRKILLYILPFNFVIWYTNKYLENFILTIDDITYSVSYPDLKRDIPVIIINKIIG